MAARFAVFASLAALAMAAPAVAQDAETIRVAGQLRDQAMGSDVAMDYGTELTTRIGPRPAGAPSPVGSTAGAQIGRFSPRRVGGPSAPAGRRPIVRS